MYIWKLKSFFYVQVIKWPLAGMVDRKVLGTFAERCVGSSPTGVTKNKCLLAVIGSQARLRSECASVSVRVRQEVQMVDVV